MGDDYRRRWSFAETAIRVARTPFDRFLSRSDERALVLLQAARGFLTCSGIVWSRFAANGWKWMRSGSTELYGIALVLRGEHW